MRLATFGLVDDMIELLYICMSENEVIVDFP